MGKLGLKENKCWVCKRPIGDNIGELDYGKEKVTFNEYNKKTIKICIPCYSLMEKIAERCLKDFIDEGIRSLSDEDD